MCGSLRLFVAGVRGVVPGWFWVGRDAGFDLPGRFRVVAQAGVLRQVGSGCGYGSLFVSLGGPLVFAVWARVRGCCRLVSSSCLRLSGVAFWRAERCAVGRVFVLFGRGARLSVVWCRCVWVGWGWRDPELARFSMRAALLFFHLGFFACAVFGFRGRLGGRCMWPVVGFSFGSRLDPRGLSGSVRGCCRWRCAVFLVRCLGRATVWVSRFVVFCAVCGSLLLYPGVGFCPGARSFFGILFR